MLFTAPEEKKSKIKISIKYYTKHLLLVIDS